MKQDTPQLGKLIEDDDRRRDAVHIAVVPVTASENLWPGEHVGFVEPGNIELVAVVGGTIGIVDPLLTSLVLKGQRFYMWIYPNTVTSLRHVWTHPAFDAAAAAKNKAFAEAYGIGENS